MIDWIHVFFRGDQRSVVVKKNIVYSSLIRIISIIVSLLLVPVTIGYVSAELYGVWLTIASIMTWLTFMDMGFTLGLQNRLTEAIAQNNLTRGKQLVSTTYWMMLIIFIPVSIVLIICVPFVNWADILNVNPIYENDIQEVIVVVVGFACLQMIVNIIVSVVTAFQMVAMSRLFPVLGNLISLLVIILLTKTTEPSLFYLSLAFSAIPVLVTLIASFFLFNGKFKEIAPSVSAINKSLVKDLFDLGYKFFIINIQALVLYQSTNVLISHVSSPLMVTEYNIAYRYLNVAMMLYTIINAPLWPAYTDAYTKGDYEWMKSTWGKMKKILWLSSALCVLMALIAPWVYKVWVGDKVNVSMLMTTTVTVYVIIYCWMTLSGTLIVGMGKITVETIMVSIGMVIHIPLSIAFSKFIGAYGVIASMSLITLAYALVFDKQLTKILNKTASGIWLK